MLSTAFHACMHQILGSRKSVKGCCVYQICLQYIAEFTIIYVVIVLIFRLLVYFYEVVLGMLIYDNNLLVTKLL